jgi:Uma2 family endonuclease
LFNWRGDFQKISNDSACVVLHTQFFGSCPLRGQLPKNWVKNSAEALTIDPRHLNHAQPRERPMTIATTKKITFEAYLNYDDGTDTRYELVRGELVAMTPPTWLHLRIARYLESQFNQEIKRLGQPWEAFREAGQQTDESSARLPDVAIVPVEFVEATLEQSAVLTVAAFLAVEIASESTSESTAAQDYRDKVTEYQTKGIPEYWVIDPDPFGAAKYIGSPKLPTVSVYTLVDRTYQVQRFQGEQIVISSTFPELQLTANRILQAGY